MSTTTINSLAVTLLAILFLGCTTNKSKIQNTDDGDTIHFKYAKHITAIAHDGYTTITLDNPWKPGTLLHTYILVNRKDSARIKNLPNGTIVYTPVESSVVTTAPHCRLLFALGAGNTIKGVCDLQYIIMPKIHELAAKGVIRNCGNSMSPSAELIKSVSPQAILVSPFENCNYGSIESLSVPIIECADYMETSALGRAEWMRFYGMLTGKASTADSLFAAVERNYTSIASNVKNLQPKPKVITERVTSGIWYCPGGASSMGRIIEDAGGHYAFANDSHSGSLTLSPEKVIEKANDADVWLFVNYANQAITPDELLAEYPGYKMIKAFNKGHIYECNSKTSTYFEEISFRPDFLIANLAAIFHPQAGINDTHRYYIRYK